MKTFVKSVKKQWKYLHKPQKSGMQRMWLAAVLKHFQEIWHLHRYHTGKMRPVEKHLHNSLFWISKTNPQSLFFILRLCLPSSISTPNPITPTSIYCWNWFGQKARPMFKNESPSLSVAEKAIATIRFICNLSLWIDCHGVTGSPKARNTFSEKWGHGTEDFLFSLSIHINII